MVWTPTAWQWLPVVLALVVLYELLRTLIVTWVKRRYERQVDRFLRQQGIPHDPFRHTHRIVVKERVLDDPGLRDAMAQRSHERDVPVYEIELQVREWLDEIVPQFNILAYYKVGYRIGRIAAYSAYNVRLDQESLHAAQAKIPEGASVVYVSNHRSNADFVVTGFMLSKSVQVSYAVGEWARVWPLENLFKAFGSYFVRRGEKDPLYHRTLEAYLQLITREGVTQAMFPEGGLSRDGAMRPVKLGLLDMMARAKLDARFRRPLVFVPVGINFDRVLEDETLIREAKGQGPPKRTVWQKIARVLSLLGKLFVGLPLNLFRFLAKRLKKHGVAAIHFGEPVVLDGWLDDHPGILQVRDRHARWDALRPFGEDLLHRIARNIPVTPTTLACHGLRRLGQAALQRGVDRGAVLLAMRQSADALEAADAPFATADPYDETVRMRRQHLVEVTARLDSAEELEAVLERALDVLAKRRILYTKGERFHSDRFDLVEYYARSLDGHLQGTRGNEERQAVAA